MEKNLVNRRRFNSALKCGRNFESINDVGAIRLRWTAAHGRQALPLHYVNELVYKKPEKEVIAKTKNRRGIDSFIGISNFLEGGKQCLGNF